MNTKMAKEIAMKLNIKKSHDDSWLRQMIYSVAGKMAMASLWDLREDDQPVSIKHFKDSLGKSFESFSFIYPQTLVFEEKNREDLINEIYDIYRRNGYFYHSPYRLSPAIPVSSGNGDISLYRGMSPSENHFMSGLGFYSFKKDNDNVPIQEMFGLQAQLMEEYLKNVLEEEGWILKEDVPLHSEFLQIKPPFTNSYWKKEPDTNGKVSLFRYGEPQRIYGFYRYDNGKFWEKGIQPWRITDFRFDGYNSRNEYRRIATSLLKKYEVLPEIKANIKEHLVEIYLGYRLPPTEEDFFKLFSWPIIFNGRTQNFRRIMAKEVYPLFKDQLKIIGYEFREEKNYG